MTQPIIHHIDTRYIPEPFQINFFADLLAILRIFSVNVKTIFCHNLVLCFCGKLRSLTLIIRVGESIDNVRNNQQMCGIFD